MQFKIHSDDIRSIFHAIMVWILLVHIICNLEYAYVPMIGHFRMSQR